MKTILHIIRKELIQFKRDKKLFGIVIIAPILQLILLGYAANLDVNKIDTIIFDMDKTVTSRDLTSGMMSSGYFNLSKYVGSYDELSGSIDKSEAIIAVIIPRDFEKKLNSGVTAEVQTIVDGSDGNKASVSLGYFQSFAGNYNKKLINAIYDRTGKKLKAGSVNAETRVWYNPEMKTRYYMVPSIMGMVLLIVTIALMSMAIVKERELGTLEQIIVTPIKPYQLIIGKLIPYTIVAFISFTIAMMIVVFWFGIQIRGSVSLLFFSSFIFLFSTLGLGLFASTISKTQQQAMMLSIFIFNMPMIYLSGFIFPIENMPSSIQYLSYIIPFKYYLTILRGIILKGIGFSELWSEFLLLFLLGILLLTFSALRFKKRLE